MFYISFHNLTGGVVDEGEAGGGIMQREMDLIRIQKRKTEEERQRRGERDTRERVASIEAEKQRDEKSYRDSRKEAQKLWERGKERTKTDSESEREK